MSWNEIVLEITYTHTADFSDALLSAGAMSVVVEDADAGTDAERPIFDEPDENGNGAAWQRSRVIAMISSGIDPHELVKQAAAECGLDELPSFLVQPVAEKDWVRLTQSQFTPIHIGKHIWVVPSWHEAPDKNAIVLEMDPGLAFGTGSHPTTQLCMEWLEEHLKDQGFHNSSVLDYGCGSGILAIAATKLGAAQVTGVDIDPQAIEAAKENANRNHCLISFYLPDQFLAETSNMRYNVVVANILSGPLQSLAPTLIKHMAPKGFLVLSGILKRQADDVIAAYAPHLTLSVWKQMDEWVILTGQLH